MATDNPTTPQKETAMPRQETNAEPKMAARKPATCAWERAREAMIAADANCIAEVPGPNDSELRFYALQDGHLRIVQTYHGKHGASGFEIYKPVTTDNTVQGTILAALDTSNTLSDAAPAMLALLQAICGSTIAHGCIDGKPVPEPILPKQFQDAALAIIAKVSRATAEPGT